MQDIKMIAGVDEAGRGPLAGPVIAAAVILNPQKEVAGITDSKKLTPTRRVELAELIRETALAWAIGSASVEEIDSLNIHHATLLAMKRAFEGLSIQPSELLVDGKFCPPGRCKVKRAIVRGDLLIPVIGAASIIAKVHRDELMTALHAQYPDYGFDQHKGYGTKHHLSKLQELGVTPIHRRSFAPVRALL